MSAANVRAMERFERGKLQAVEDEREAAKRPDVVRLPIDRLTGGPKVRRERHDLDHVRALMERGQWPPILVTAELTHGGCHRIIDGNHRHAAAKRLGHAAIDAILFEGDAAEVLEQAVKANVDHGLPLTIQERHSLAKQFIETTDWADIRIARCCGLSDKTIASLRPRPSRATSETPKLRGGDGKARPATSTDAAKNRERAAEEIQAKPDASDREIAKRTGISPRTVADVRRRNAEGMDPVPERLKPQPEPEQKPKLQAVPDPGPEPENDEPKGVTAGDVLGTTIPSDWRRMPGADRTNETREFARFMNRWGRVVKFQKDWNAHLSQCPPDAREEVLQGARWMAEQWSAFATSLERQPTVEVTE